MRFSTIIALLPFAAAAPYTTPGETPMKRDRPAPLLVPRGGRHIPGKYIVRMRSGVISTSVTSAVSSIKAEADHQYSHAFSGFAATMDDDELEKIRSNPDVESVEQDAWMSIFATQQGAPWGISRLSSKQPGGTTYNYDDSAGQGTCAYILDTGIDETHPEFEGRASWANNFSQDGKTDGVGHGTHVAGTIGSKTYGVAKKTKIYAVKVLGNDGSGTNSAVIAGMDWVAQNADKTACPKGIVVNMSLGGGVSQMINQAAAKIVDAGLFLAAAAGNEAANAGTSSPASEPTVCTVGASDKSDKIAEFSNFGKLVDIFAPGVGILSTVPGGKTEQMDGTSMASPHIAGLAAYLMGTGQKAQGLCEYIGKSALQGVISGAPNGTTTNLANNGYDGK